jgi:opacity protein-like surface antigen
MKRMMNQLTRVFFSIALLMMSGALVLAQTTTKDEYPKVEVFVGLSAVGSVGENQNEEIRFDNGGRIGSGYAGDTGFEISAVRNWTRYIGLKGDFSAHFKNHNTRGLVSNCTPVCTTATQDFQIKTRVYNFLAGPEFKARNSTRLTPFAHLLGGVAHTTASFTTPGPTLNISLDRSDTSFAMALGGGLDIRATKRVSFRAQMDYNPIFQNSTSGGRRDLVRISLGALFH